MKLVATVAMICLLGTSQIIISDFESEYGGYENQIVGIDEFDTPTSTKIILSFTNSNPVCAYNPESYNESIDDTVYRAFMPNTGIDDNLQTSLDIDPGDDGVELLLHGESIQKFIGKNHVIFVVKK